MPASAGGSNTAVQAAVMLGGLDSGQDAGAALTRGQLLADAWGYDYICESRTVDVHINRVRRKLGLQHEIQTVFKVGYRLNTRGTL